MLLNTFIASGLAFFTFRTQNKRGARWLGWIMLAGAWWSLTNLGELHAASLPARIFWSKLHYFGATSVPVLMLLFVLDYCGYSHLFSRRILPFFWVVPVGTIVLAWTNEWHNLIWTSFTPQRFENVTLVVYGHGPAYWVMIAYAYLCVAASIVLLLRVAWQQQHIYRRQAITLIFIILLPWLGEVAYNARLLPGLDFTVFGLTLSGVLLAWNLGFFKLLKLMPIATDRIFTEMKYAVVVLDERLQVINFNPAAREMLNLPADAVGRQVPANLMTALQEQAGQSVNTELKWPGPPPRLLQVTASLLTDRRNRTIGRLIMCQDITGLKKSQEALWLRQLDVALLEERQAVSREMHSATRQALQEMVEMSQHATQLLEKEQPAAAATVLARMGEIIHSVDADIDQFVQQNLSWNAEKPASPDFFEALAEYIDHFSRTRQFPVIFTYPGTPVGDLLTPVAQIQLLRIVEQALHISEHAASTEETQIIVSHSAGWVQTVITQVGDQELPALLQERAGAVGGSIETRNVPGHGRQWIIQLPCAQPDRPPVAFTGLRVLLVDDHQVLLEGFKDLLERRGLQVVAAVCNGAEAVKLARQHLPDLVLMDIRMPGMSGIEATRQIKAELPQVKVAMLTVSHDQEDLIAALRAGADGYLLKTLDPDEFFRLLADVLSGSMPVSPDLARELIVDIARVEEYEPKILTSQQLDVLRLVAQGNTYRHVGEELSLSEHTVRYHVEQIRRKLSAENRAEAVARAIQLGLIETPA
ncbi:MAG: hypothetical protein Kow0031_18340 [Anaerolineae bacterium]